MSTTHTNGKTEAFNTPRILPATIINTPPQRTLPSAKGTVAIYKGNNFPQISFRIPASLNAEFGPGSVAVKFAAPDTWELTHTDFGATFNKSSGTKYLLEIVSRETFDVTGHFYSTPADFVMTEDGAILVNLTEPPRKQPNAPQIVKSNATRSKERVAIADTKPTEIETITTIAETSTSTRVQLAALLEAIRRTEATTEYRLRRDKDTQQWVFAAPVIR